MYNHWIVAILEVSHEIIQGIAVCQFHSIFTGSVKISGKIDHYYIHSKNEPD